MTDSQKETKRNDAKSIITEQQENKCIRDLRGEYIPYLETLKDGDGNVTWARSFAWPLDFYFRRSHINGAQHRAGCDFHRLWLHGVVQSGFAQVRYEVRAGGNTVTEPDLVTEIEYKAAISSIQAGSHSATRQVRDVVYRVCALGISAGRGNISLLKDGLNDLYNHFKALKTGEYKISKDGD